MEEILSRYNNKGSESSVPEASEDLEETDTDTEVYVYIYIDIYTHMQIYIYNYFLIVLCFFFFTTYVPQKHSNIDFLLRDK